MTHHDDDDTLCSFTLAELEPLYEPNAFAVLLARTLDQLASDGRALEAHLASGAFEAAAQRLHRIKGTVSLFAHDGLPLGPLHEAEAALRRGETAALAVALPRARCVVAALTRTLTLKLNLELELEPRCALRSSPDA